MAGKVKLKKYKIGLASSEIQQPNKIKDEFILPAYDHVSNRNSLFNDGLKRYGRTTSKTKHDGPLATLSAHLGTRPDSVRRWLKHPFVDPQRPTPVNGWMMDHDGTAKERISTMFLVFSTSIPSLLGHVAAGHLPELYPHHHRWLPQPHHRSLNPTITNAQCQTVSLCADTPASLLISRSQRSGNQIIPTSMAVVVRLCQHKLSRYRIGVVP